MGKKRKRKGVILLDLSIALDFVFYNTKVHCKKETFGVGHRSVDGHGALEDSDGTQ